MNDRKTLTHVANSPLGSSAEMKKDDSSLEKHETLVAAAIAEVTDMRPFNISLSKGPRQRAFGKWMDTILVAGAAVLMGCAPIGGMLMSAHAMQTHGGVVLLGLKIANWLGWIAVSGTVASGLAFWWSNFWRPAQHYVAEYRADGSCANDLARYGSDVLADVDAWLEQKSKRYERRLMRFFGGADKLAFIAIAGIALSLWKESQVILQGLPALVTHVGGPFLAGMVLCGLAFNRAIERLGFHRDLVRIAVNRKERERAWASQ